MEKKKKITNAQLERRLRDAIVHVDKTKDTKSVFFSDKGLRLTVTEDYAVIATDFHSHVFSNFTMDGYSRPYLYTQQVVDIALSHDCVVDDGYAYSKLLETLKSEKDEPYLYNLCAYFEWWLMNIFSPLYGIGETVLDSFLVYEDYVHNIARNMVLFNEHTEDITNVAFLDAVIANMKTLTSSLQADIVIPKKSDEDIMQENMDAMRENELNESVQGAQWGDVKWWKCVSSGVMRIA